MPAARGMKRAASKSSAATASTGPKNKKKRGRKYHSITVLGMFSLVCRDVNDLSNSDGGKSGSY